MENWIEFLIFKIKRFFHQSVKKSKFPLQSHSRKYFSECDQICWSLVFLRFFFVEKNVDKDNLASNIESEPSKEIEKSLVIPEKASSFKVHPERICQDQCFYCGGKFGLYDTPCHIAQIKSIERQNKILASEFFQDFLLGIFRINF